MTNAALVQITKNHLLETSYWNKIEIKFSSKNNSIDLKVNDLFVSNNATCLKYFHFQPIICGKYEFYGKEAGTGPSTKYHVYSDCGK